MNKGIVMTSILESYLNKIDKLYTPEDILKVTSLIKYDNHTDDDKYIIKTPKEIITSKSGICYDFVELERKLFSALKYEFKTFFVYDDRMLTVSGEIKHDDYSSHTFLVFKENDKYFWFESSWRSHKGIHGPFKNYKDVCLFVSKQLKKSKWKSVNMIEYDLFDYKNMNIFQFGEYIVRNFKKLF